MLGLTLLTLLTLAHAQDPTRQAAERGGSPWSGSATLSTSFVSGPVNPGTTTRTLTGLETWGSTWNPAVDVGLALAGSYRARPSGVLTLSWSARRAFRFPDVDGDAPEGVGEGAAQAPVSLGDLTLSYLDDATVEADDRRVGLLVAGRLTLPASRESLVCNPMIAALGASVGARVSLGPTTRLRLAASADVVGHVHGAAPIGACSQPGTAPVVQTLTGPVSPAPDGGWATPNPLAVFGGSASLIGWHGIFGLLPGATGTKAWSRVLTDLTVALRAQVQRPDGATSTSVLTGQVDVPAAASPPVVQVPFVVGVGGVLTDHLALRGSLSNAVPAVLYDPSARLRSLPSTLTVGLSLTGSW